MISKSWSTSKKRAMLYRQAGELAEFCLQLFPLIVVHSDDYGAHDADAETVKLLCDPGSPRPVEDFDQALGWFERVGLIRRYEADGRAWLQIEKFDENQPGLLSKRSDRKSPTGPTNTELPGISGLTKPNLTKPNLTLSLSTPSTAPPAAQELVDLWNQVVTPPLPKVTKLTADRRAKLNARLKEYPDLATWRTLIAWVNGQDWCRASGSGDHPNWTATLDWLCKSDGQVQRYIERATQNQQRTRPRVAGCRHTPPCATPVDCTRLRDAERRAIPA